MSTKHTTKYNSGSLRVISGVWRGRKIVFPNNLDIRPTSDRTRETLFNWLNPDIRDATCLDLFAGSGILGIEALSRGAKKVVSVEQNSKAIRCLRENIKKFNSNAMQIINTTIPSTSKLFDYPFDIIFVDPPFRKNLLPK
ncbi:MAG: 16S rRNA (guanine(966)-N(2))-methyltransferase RsmD, partial [Legionellales bacterium]|nr:16S rRNA (guanine(966)-N(2))-methyltransferase RsmD [Legionellales bacterium]